MITSITFGKFVDRVQKYLANNWPDIANNITSNELLTYVYGSMGGVIELDAEQKYQLDGVYPDQDGFVTTYSFTGNQFQYNWTDNLYTVQLPFPIVNLPLGYAIQSPHFTGIGGSSFPLIAVHGYQKGFTTLPTPDFGAFYRVENSIMTIDCPNVDLVNSGWVLKVPMKSPRSATGSKDDVINMPDGALERVFDMVVQKLIGRKQQPQTNINSGVERYTEQP